MSSKEEKVMALMEAELAKDPGAATGDLFEKAKAIDPAVGKMSLRQFHARYPLQIKRRRNKSAPAGSGRSSRRKGGRKASAAPRRRRAQGGTPNASVRDVFIRFAEDLTAAEDRRHLVKVLANVDRYVEDAVKAAGR